MKKTLSVIMIICVTVSVVFLSKSSCSAQTPINAEPSDKAIVTEELWGVKLRFEGYQPWTAHPLYGKPNFVLAGISKSGTCDLIMSMFAEEVPPSTTPEQCRKNYVGNPETLKNNKDAKLLEHKSSPLTYTLFDLSLKEQQIYQHQAYGYWTRNDICFEIHISSTKCGDEFKDTVMPILESVHLSPDKGATHETVAIARKTGQPPGDWRIHMLLGGHYLHIAKPPIPARARRFYMSAQNLAGSQLDLQSLWSIEEGIGLAWLLEDNGEKAIPYLKRALEIARKNTNTKMLSSSLYNTACALSLTGDLKQACNNLDELFTVMDEKDKQIMLSHIKQDKHIAPIRNTDCYSNLMQKQEKK